MAGSAARRVGFDLAARKAALLREAGCSDGMSNTQHPMSARVSLPDGQLLAGCCRVPKPAKDTTDTTAKPLTLEGPTWQLDSPSGSFAGIAIDAAKPVTVRFEAGRLSGFSGCNRLMGGYNLSTGKVKISMLAGSMMACPEPQTALDKRLFARVGRDLGLGKTLAEEYYYGVIELEQALAKRGRQTYRMGKLSPAKSAKFPGRVRK